MRRICGLALVLVLGGCTTAVDPMGGSTDPVEPAIAADPAVTAPFDVGDVVRRAQLSFREEDHEFVGGLATYHVRVGATGVATFAPSDWSMDDGEQVVTTGRPIELETVGIARDTTAA